MSKTKSQRLEEQVREHTTDLSLDVAAEESTHFQQVPTLTVQQSVKRNYQLGDVELARITPDPDQPRKSRHELDELTQSIREHGLLQPIVLREDPDTQGHFIIIAGEGRYLAHQELGLTSIQALVRKDLNEHRASILSLIENLKREDLNPIDEANGYARVLAQTGMTHDELAKQIGKSRVYVTEQLSLLENLTREEQDQISRCRPADRPGNSLILKASRTDDPETRAALLAGRLTRAEGRAATRQKKGRKPNVTRTFRFDQPPGQVTVTLRSSELNRVSIAQLLEHACLEFGREMDEL